MSNIIRKSVDCIYKHLPAGITGVSGQLQEMEKIVIANGQEMEKIVIGELRCNEGEVTPRHVSSVSEYWSQGRVFVRLAGLFGAIAVGLGAYGAHIFDPSHAAELQLVFETANRYHFFHTIALLGVPLTKRPILVGTLLSLGMLIFSGSCYYHALTGSIAIRQITPYGGTLLIIAWLAMIF